MHQAVVTSETFAAEQSARASRIGRPTRATVVDLALVASGWVFTALLRLAPFGQGPGLDDITYSAPAQRITLQAWLHGRIPLWSNANFGGTPHLGNMQTAALYPGHLLAAPFPDLLGADIELVAHMLLFGGSWYVLGRCLHLRRPAPVAMALLAMCSGASLIRSSLLVHFPPLAWAPLAMVCILQLVRTARPIRMMAATAMVMWCIVVSGHPQSVLMVATLLGAWTVGLIVEQRAWKRTGYLLGSIGLALMMAAPLLLAVRHSIHAAAETSRDLDSLRQANYFVPIPKTVWVVIGRPFDSIKQLLSYGELVTYAGSVAFFLAVLGAAFAVRTRVWSLVSMLLVGLFATTLAWGVGSPSLRFARAVLPGFDQPRVSARWNWVLAMVIVLLAGVGIDRLRCRPSRVEMGALVGAIAMVIALPILGFQRGGTANTAYWLVAALLVLALCLVRSRVPRRAAAAMLVALAMFELGMPAIRLMRLPGHNVASTESLISAGPRWLSNTSGLTLAMVNEVPTAQYLTAGMRPNANALADVRSIDGYDGGVAVSRRWHAALRQFLPKINGLTFRAQLPFVLPADRMARLGVRYIYYDPDRGPGATNFPLWIRRFVDDHFEIYENPFWIGDVRVWYQSEAVPSPEAAGNVIRGEFPRIHQTVMVERTDLVLTCARACDHRGFTSSSDVAGERHVTIDADHDALVMFDEQFDTGWVVTVDGQRAEAVPLDGAWTGVRVSAGHHQVQLRYRPRWLTMAMITMMLGWLFSLIAIVVPGHHGVRRRLRADALPGQELVRG